MKNAVKFTMALMLAMFLMVPANATNSTSQSDEITTVLKADKDKKEKKACTKEKASCSKEATDKKACEKKSCGDESKKACCTKEKDSKKTE